MGNSSVLITGGASGIGRATAVAFARQGSAVAVADIDRDGCAETVRRCRDLGVDALGVPTDVCSESQVEAMLAAAVERFGAPAAAVNCAGVEMDAQRTLDCALHEWQRIVSVNLTGTFLCVRAELTAMLAAGAGAIVNLSSIAGVVGLRGQVAYSASKHGVVGLTRTVALEYAARGIRINAICPGPVDTPMLRRAFEDRAEALQHLTAHVPAGRIATADEIASVAVWLCSSSASYLNGQAVPVDGAMTAQ